MPHIFHKENAGEITIRELKSILDKNDPDFCLIDVREQDEWNATNIKGAALRPLSRFQETYQDLPRDKTIYLYCKSGSRSLMAAQFLKEKGYTKVFNVKGGIDAWMRETGPDMPK